MGSKSAIASSPLPLCFPSHHQLALEPYIPSSHPANKPETWNAPLPTVTLTYATSLDGAIAQAPGRQTKLSGVETKAMTHYIRSRHDAILIGVGTALADDPALNCRLEGVTMAQQPRPIILDPKGRWQLGPNARILKICQEGLAKAPWIVVGPETRIQAAQTSLLEEIGGMYVRIDQVDEQGHFRWEDVLQALAMRRITSVMIEGGARIIHSLLRPECRRHVTSVIVTVAAIYLGAGSLTIGPSVSCDGNECKAVDQGVLRLNNVKWLPMGNDVVMCACAP